MRRSLFRSITVLMVLAVLALSTLATPAFAGFSSGGGAEVLQYLQTTPDAHCAYFVDAESGHTFVALRVGNGNPHADTTGVPGLKLVGPVDADGIDAIPALLP